MSDRSTDKEHYWRNLIARFDPRHDTIRSFRRRLGVGEHSFYWWRRELGGRPPTPPPVFQPVVVLPTAAAPETTLEVRSRGHRDVQVRPGFDAALLRQLVLLLEAPPQAPADPC